MYVCMYVCIIILVVVLASSSSSSSSSWPSSSSSSSSSWSWSLTKIEVLNYPSNVDQGLGTPSLNHTIHAIDHPFLNVTQCWDVFGYLLMAWGSLLWKISFDTVGKSSIHNWTLYTTANCEKLPAARFPSNPIKFWWLNDHFFLLYSLPKCNLWLLRRGNIHPSPTHPILFRGATARSNATGRPSERRGWEGWANLPDELQINIEK